jgi:Tol biopolymer transport system component
VALQRIVGGNPDIFLLDLVRGGFTRLTFDPSLDNYPLWSPDGTQIAFRSDRKGSNLYLKPASGTGPEEPLLTETVNNKVLQDWSSDGRFLLYYEVDPKTGRDLWVLDLTAKERKPRVFANAPFDETMAQFSPDGHWVAYQTNESGQPEIVVQPFPEPNGKWQVSTSGGSSPRWRPDGKELYFVAKDGKLMAVPIKVSGSTFDYGIPQGLFSPRFVSGTIFTINKPQYDVARDGRFLINQSMEESSTAPITLILNWKPPQ